MLVVKNRKKGEGCPNALYLREMDLRRVISAVFA